MTVALSAPAAPELAGLYRAAHWWTDSSLRSGLEQAAALDPDAVAVVDNETSWSYGGLREAAERAVHVLQSRGVEPGDPVVLIAPNCGSAVVAFAAILRCSAVAVVLDRRSGASDVAHAIKTTRPRLVIAPLSLIALLSLEQSAAKVVSFDDLSAGTQTHDEWNEPDQDAPAVVLFTSGTTSRPKGVVHTLHTLSSGARNLAVAFGFGDGDTPFLSSPLASITGLAQLHMVLTAGARIVLEDHFSPAGSLHHLERNRATLIGGAPVIAEMLFAEYAKQERSTTSLRAIALGGTMIPRQLLQIAVEQFSVEPVRVYGSSEAPIHTASQPQDDRTTRLSSDGAPLPGSEVRIGSADHESELLVRGPNLFGGYLEKEHNESSFEDGWFRTGDLAEMVDGRLVVRGRLKEVIARKGLKISLGEVDEAIRGLPSAIEWGVFGLPDRVTGERLGLAVRTDSPDMVSYEAVCTYLLAGGLARQKLPEQIVVWTDPLPRTATGKLLRDNLAGDGTQQIHLAPRLRS